MLVYSKYPAYKTLNGNTRTNGVAGKRPATNIYETKDDYRIDLAVPGFSKNDFNIEVENDELRISAAVKSESNESETVLRKEFGFDQFERVFIIPETVDTDSIKASYKNGILSVKMLIKDDFKPKPPREISVN
mgnify:CR=1 FL=1